MKKWNVYEACCVRAAKIALTKCHPSQRSRVHKQMEQLQRDEKTLIEWTDQFALSSMQAGDRSSYEIAIQELRWIARKRITVYPDSPELVTHLDGLKIKADMEALAMFPYKTFALAFPLGAKIGKRQHDTVPVLVSFAFPRDDRDDMQGMYRKNRIDMDIRAFGSKVDRRHFRMVCASDDGTAIYNTIPDEDIEAFLGGELDGQHYPATDVEGKPLQMD